MPRRAKTPGIYPRVLRRTNRTVYDAVVTVDNVQRTKRGFANPTAAKAWQDEKRVDMRRGVDVRAPSGMTVGELVWDKWLPVQLAECSTARSRETYTYWAQRIYGDLGDLPLRRLGKLDVTAWRTWLVTSSADATARGVFSAFVAAIRWAVAHDLIPRDVTLATKRPKAAPRNPPVQPIDVVQQLLERAEREEQPTGLMVWLGTVLGLRFGEAVSLQWEQINFADKRIRLNRIVQRQEKGTIKTDAGERTIGLTDADVEKLRDYRQEQMREYTAKGAAPPRLVVLRADGHPVKAPWFWWRFNAVREALGLPWLHFHDLRHVNATMLARAGVHPKVAQERLGHANFSTTMAVYTHVGAEQQSEAAEALGMLMRKGHP